MTTWTDEQICNKAWTYLCGLDDRTSPADYPDHALITKEELAMFMRCIAAQARARTVEECLAEIRSLIELNSDGDGGHLLSRRDCISLVRSMGWPDPPRSRCWMCPNQSPAEWDDLDANYPSDAEKAREFERMIQDRDPTVYLRDEKGSRGDCMSGFCFT